MKLDPSRLAGHALLARIYLQAKKLSDAQREFKAVVQLGDSTGTGRFGLALVLLAESRYSEALPHLRAAAEASPKDPERLFTLMSTELKLKQVAQARRIQARIEKLWPRDPWLSYRLGKALLEDHLTQDAETEFERAATNLAEAKDGSPPPDVRLADFYFQIAQARFDHRDYQETLGYLRRIPPGHPEPNLQAAAVHLEGEALLGLGKAEQARAKIREAARLDPSTPDHLTRLAWAELQAGDIRGATEAASEAGRRWPEDPRVHHMLGLVERESLPQRVRVSFSADWHIKGEGLVCCPCTVPCPCRSNGRPSYRHCENVGGYRITNGHYGSVPLEGLIFAIVSTSMETQNAPSAIYVDRLATDEQIIAFERLLQSFDPLLPSLFLNVRRADVSFINSPGERNYELRVPRVLQVRIRRQLDSQGGPVLQTAALDHFSNTIEYAQNLTYKVWEGERVKWDYSGRQAN